jgi:hypothetical protein
MVRRRGCYVEPNGTWNYWVSIPWMAAEQANVFYRLWQLTGDLDAAVTCVGLAESLMMENATWGVPGEMGGYSGNPWLGRMSSNYNAIIAPVFAHAWELTGAPELLLWARETYRAMIERDTVDAITNNYWLVPSLLHALHLYRDIKTPVPEPPDVRVLPDATPEA